MISFIKNSSEYKIFYNNINCGVCHFCFPLNNDDKVIFVSWLEIYPYYRNKKLGTRLLYEVMKDYYQKGYRYIELVDGSSCYRKKKNIYKSLSLYYKSYDNDMRGNLRHILYGKKCGF